MCASSAVRSAALLIFVTAALAADPKPGSAEGTALNAITGIPIKKALITLRSEADNTAYQVLSDAAGRFRFESVQPGKYALCGEAQGFVAAVPDGERAAPPSALVNVAEGQDVKDLAVRLQPYGVLAGTVLDESGEPVRNATVYAGRYKYSRAGKKLYDGETVAQRTNDRGEFRVYDVPPGRWYLEVSRSIETPKTTGRLHGAPDEESYPLTYYPGVWQESEAAAIEVAPGAELANFEIRLRKARTWHIRGKVSGAPGGQAQVRLHFDNLWYITFPADGSFDLGSLVKGTHVLTAEVIYPDRLYSAPQQVTISDRDVNGVALRLEAGITLKGSALVDGAAPSAVQGARLSLEPVADGYPAGARVAADGSFAIEKLAPRTYWVSAGNKSIYLKSMQFGDRDISSDGRVEVLPSCGPLTLRFGYDAAQLQGTIPMTPSALALIRVTLAPEGGLTDRADLFKMADIDDATGAFQIEGIAPGDYKLFVWGIGRPEPGGVFRLPQAAREQGYCHHVRAGRTQNGFGDGNHGGRNRGSQKEAALGRCALSLCLFWP